MDIYPRCDDGTLPPDSPLKQWADYLLDTTARAYRPIAYNAETRQMLQAVGFVDISEQVIKVPLNPWPSDPQEKTIGRWYNLGLVQGLQALSLAPLTRMYQWKKEDVDRMVQLVQKDICNKNHHIYCYM